MNSPLRDLLVSTALQWERKFGNAPSITTVLSEYDAAMLLGVTEDDYSKSMQEATTVQKGFDFALNGMRYQVKGNRPSGKPGSTVSWVPKATNNDWDRLVWVHYDPGYQIQEAWLWEVSAYKAAFHDITRLSPTHHRLGKRLAPLNEA